MRLFRILFNEPWMAFVFFLALLFTKLSEPNTLIFDEIHYVPAAKNLITFALNLNLEHPPLAKLILGAFWVVFHGIFKILNELLVFRFASACFGLWLLFGIYRWMLALGFSKAKGLVALWLTGFNFLWFVQSRTAMLDIFYCAFGVWGLLDLYKVFYLKQKPRTLLFRGWTLIGFACACKWSAVPFFALGIYFGRKAILENLCGVLVGVGAYFLAFVPLLFLEVNPLTLETFIPYQKQMWDLLGSSIISSHPYASKWWQWPTLIRPMWYSFEEKGTLTRGIWAGGNPALYWVSLPLLVAVLFRGVFKKDGVARVLAAFYWLPLLFWILAPRKLQLYFYYLPSSLWLGPIVVWAQDRFANSTRFLQGGRRAHGGWLLWGFVLLCAALFFYFLPIMDGRALDPERFRVYMWLESWI